MRIGLGIPPTGLPFDLCVDIVQQAEARGFESVWTGEAWGTETCALVSALLARSRRIHIGTGIMSIYLRPPTLAAMQAATLGLIGPGRAQIGLGVSTQNINAFHGVPWDRPAARMREYVEIMRRVLAGERLTYAGEFYQPSRFGLSILPPEPPPLCLAAVNPLMLRLAGEIADSVLLAWLPARQLQQSLAEIAKGAARAGRTLADIDIGCYLHTMVTEDRERALEQLRHVLLGYSMANTYIKGFRSFGYGEVLEEVHDRWQAGDRAGAEAAIPDSMVEELYIFGAPEACYEQLNGFIEQGVNFPVVAAPPTSRLTSEDVYALVKAFAQ